MIEGGCYCGAVRFGVSGKLRPVCFCHCSQCRRFSGHFVAATAALDAELAIIGEVTWYQSSDEAKRGFCAKCGTQLFWKHCEQNSTSVMAGSIDDHAGLKSERHIFMADKAGYYVIEDGLPKFDGPAGEGPGGNVFEDISGGGA